MKYFAFRDAGHTKVLRAATETEEAEYLRLSMCLVELTQDMKRPYIVNKAMEELCYLGRPVKCKSLAVDEDANRLTMNFLFAFRTYLDHWETRLKRKYKSDTGYYSEFVRLTRNAYDSYIEYRITYRMRNFVQHCDVPITLTTYPDSADGFIHTQYMVERDRLLTEFDEWKTDERDYLSRQPVAFDIQLIFLAAQNAINEINRGLIRYCLSLRLTDSCNRFLLLRKELGVSGNSLFLYSQTDQQGAEQDLTTGRTERKGGYCVNHSMFAWELCEAIVSGTV